MVFVLLVNLNIKSNAYSAHAFCLYDPVARKVIDSYNMQTKLSMASTTKIMTALLYGLMLESGNDAALAIAVSISYSQKTFAKLMNEKAKQIGMKNTNFVTPNGLDDEFHYTTAFDMAVLGGYAMENEMFSKVVSTKAYKAIYNGTETHILQPQSAFGNFTRRWGH